MKLDQLLGDVATTGVEGSLDRDITSICHDSRRVKPGALFVAMKGENVDGAAFIPKAIAAGAEAVVTETDADTGKATKVFVPVTPAILRCLAGFW